MNAPRWKMKILGMIAAAFVAAMPALAQNAVKAGKFAGGSGHETSGSVQIIELDGAYVVRLGADFVQDGGAPDVIVGLGKDGYSEGSNLGPLISLTGAQDYAIPAGVDPATFNEVWIWCKKFAVPLGVAKLN